MQIEKGDLIIASFKLYPTCLTYSSPCLAAVTGQTIRQIAYGPPAIVANVVAIVFL